MRKLRKKFKRPKVSWDSESIKENKNLAAEYGLRRRKEILISHETLRKFRQRARQLIAEKDEENKKVLMDKLAKIGLLVGEGKELDDVLALTVRNVLDRRLQTIIFKKGVATSPLHARQLIVHGHVKINGRKVKFPSYSVTVEQEKGIEITAEKPKPKKQRPAQPSDKSKQDASTESGKISEEGEVESVLDEKESVEAKTEASKNTDDNSKESMKPEDAETAKDDKKGES